MKLPHLLAAALFLSIVPGYSNDNKTNPPPTSPPPPTDCSGSGKNPQSLSWWHNIGETDYSAANDLLAYSRVGALVGSKLGEQPTNFSQVYKAFNGGKTTKLNLQLCFDQKTITAAIANPSILSLNTANTNAKILMGTGNVIRQVRTDSEFTDVSPLSSGAGFIIRSWNFSAIPTLQQSGGYFILPTQTPYYSATFTNPDYPTDLHRIDITVVDNSGSSSHTITERYEETYLPAPNDAFPDTFTISTYDGANVSGTLIRRELIQYSNRGAGTTSGSAATTGTRRYWDYNIERTISEATLGADGAVGSLAVISHTFEQFADFSIYSGTGPDTGGLQNARRLISMTVGYGAPEAATSTYTYINNPSNPLVHGRLQSQSAPDGSWEYHEYTDMTDSPVAIETEWTSWKDVAMTDKENARKTVTTIEQSKTTAVTTIAGQMVASTQTQLETLADGSLLTTTSTWTGTEWAVSASCRYPQDSTAITTSGRIKWTENADGTASTYAYVSISGGYKVTASTGAGNRNGITDGIRTVETYNTQNILLSKATYDILTGLQLDMVAYSNLDNDGRPQRTDYPLDGTYEINQYSCCGLGFTRDRNGATRTYFRDALKRPYLINTQRSSNGPVVYETTAYNGLTTTQTSSSGSISLFRSETTNNLAGDTVQQKSPDANGDGNPEITTIATTYPSGGGKTVTVTYPDGSTSVSNSYIDGQPKSTSGTAVNAMTYDYGTHALNGGGTWSQSIAANGTQWSKSYSDSLNRSFRTEYPDGAISTQSYYPFNAALGWRGKAASSTDPDGITTTFTYNAEGELTTTSQPMPGNQQRVTVTNSDVVNDSTIGISTRQTTTINGVLVSTSLRQAIGYSSKIVALSGTTTSISSVPNNGAWTSTSTAPDGTYTVASYADGLMIKQQTFGSDHASIKSITMTNDAFGRVLTSVDSRTGTTTMGPYLENGSLTSVTDPGNRTISYTYDVMGRRLSTTLPDNSVTYTGYTAKGQVEASWGSQTYPTFNTFDALGRKVTLRTNPILDVNGKPTDAGGSVTTWHYDSQRGWLTSKLDAADQGATYTYTSASRLSSRTWARTNGGQPLTTAYAYDAGMLVATGYSDTTPGVMITYDNFGRQVTQSNGLAQSAYSYDSATLQLTTETISYNLDGQPGYEFTRVINRSYDSLLRPAGFQLKDGTSLETQVSYTYGATDGRLATVSSGTGAFSYGYVGNSNLLASVTGPVHTVTNTWEANRDVIASKQNSVGSTIISQYDYNVNNLGQRTNVSQSGTAFSAVRSIAWDYDNLGQVVKADSSVNTDDRAFEYDGIGNRLKSADSLTLPTANNYVSNVLNQYTAIDAINPVYDTDGNATAYPLPTNPSANSTLTWDAENRLISTTVNGVTTTYQYDSQSRRISKSTNGSNITFVYDGWNCIAEYAGSALTKVNTWGMDLSGSMRGAGGVGGLLAVKIDSVTYYPTFDGNGNVSEYINNAGAVTAHFEYDPFGRVVVDTDSSGQFAYRFSTKGLDSETGLYYYGYRYLDPSTGRWPSRDPIQEQGGMNLYVFVENNAVKFWDYLGEFIQVSNPEFNLDNHFGGKSFSGTPCNKCCVGCKKDGENLKISDNGSKGTDIKLKLDSPTFTSIWKKDYSPKKGEDCCAGRIYWYNCYTKSCFEKASGLQLHLKGMKPVHDVDAETALATSVRGYWWCSCENGFWRCNKKNDSFAFGPLFEPVDMNDYDKGWKIVTKPAR